MQCGGLFLWLTKEYSMKFSDLKNKNFMVKEQEGGFVLVHPSRGKFDWEPGELGFRSVVFDDKGNTVSVGWPKFFNQNEWPDSDTLIAGELENGRAVITHKHDGSLIIRSVLPGGRILFRTRDTFDGGKFAPLAHAVASCKYPALLNPEWWAHGSLLFEYVGEENQIVVRYGGADDLIFLGAAQHNGTDKPRYLTYAELETVAQEGGLRLVETYDWADTQNARGVGEILGMVKDWDKAEGVVVRSGDAQTLLKVKSAWYFAQHALRFHVKLDTIARFAIDGDLRDEAAFLQKLTETGWDYETAQTALKFFHEYLTRRAKADAIKATALAFVAGFDKETGGPHGFADEKARRKAFALRITGPNAASETKGMMKYLFLAYDNRASELEAVLLRRVIMGPGQ